MGMKCQEIFDRLGDYLDREIDPELCKKLEEHIQGCEPCIAFINTLQKTVELFGRLREGERPMPPHLSERLHSFLAKSIEPKRAE